MLLGPSQLVLAVTACLALRALAQVPLTVTQEEAWRELKPYPRNDSTWLAVHQGYVAELDAFRNSSQSVDLMVFGDSITEAFRGTAFGHRVRVFQSNRRAWRTLIAKRYVSGVYSIAADSALHLLWRLRKGGGPEGVDVKVIIVEIGVNNLRPLTQVYPEDPEKVPWKAAHAIGLVLEELREQAPGAQLVVLSLLPFSPNWDSRWQPFVDSVNQLLQEAADPEKGVHYADCSHLFFEKGSPPQHQQPQQEPQQEQKQVDRKMIRDGIHPVGPGALAYAVCVRSAFRQALNANQEGQDSEAGPG